MNSQKIDFTSATDIDRDAVRRKAEELRGEQVVRLIQGLGRILSAGYSRLATYGEEMNVPARSSRGLF